MDCSPPDSSIHGILWARILEWVALSFSGVFPTQGSNPGLHCSQTLYSLSHQGSLVIHECSVNVYGLSNEVLCEARMEMALYTYNQTHIETHATAQSLVEMMERWKVEVMENCRLM